MNRQEQIENAKNAYMAKIGALPIADEPRNNLDVVVAFIQGAEWADRHPDIDMVVELRKKDIGEVFSAYEEWHKARLQELIEEACEWLRNNWRNYVGVDADGIACFGHWENDFRKAMKGG